MGWLFLPIQMLIVCLLFLQQVGIDRGDIPDLSQVSPNADSKDNRFASLQVLYPSPLCFYGDVNIMWICQWFAETVTSNILSWWLGCYQKHFCIWDVIAKFNCNSQGSTCRGQLLCVFTCFMVLGLWSSIITCWVSLDHIRSDLNELLCKQTSGIKGAFSTSTRD